jgi:DNA-directed RNA polymerase specialized sigma24 family protein
VRLKHLAELTFADIGVRLGMSENTAKSLYYRGLVKLRELLAPRPGEGP